MSLLAEEIWAIVKGLSAMPAGVVAIPLTRGLRALVDEADAPLVVGRPWHAQDGRQSRENWYAAQWDAGRAPRSLIMMHRRILSVHASLEVDHANGIGLDNRRENLRPCTRSLNTANNAVRLADSGFHGVWRHGRWFRARIKVDGRTQHLGYFDEAQVAARAYDAAAIDAFGEFARLNFPDERRA